MTGSGNTNAASTIDSSINSVAKSWKACLRVMWKDTLLRGEDPIKLGNHWAAFLKDELAVADQAKTHQASPPHRIRAETSSRNFQRLTSPWAWVTARATICSWPLPSPHRRRQGGRGRASRACASARRSSAVSRHGERSGLRENCRLRFRRPPPSRAPASSRSTSQWARSKESRSRTRRWRKRPLRRQTPRPSRPVHRAAPSPSSSWTTARLASEQARGR